MKWEHAKIIYLTCSSWFSFQGITPIHLTGQVALTKFVLYYSIKGPSLHPQICLPAFSKLIAQFISHHFNRIPWCLRVQITLDCLSWCSYINKAHNSAIAAVIIRRQLPTQEITPDTRNLVNAAHAVTIIAFGSPNASRHNQPTSV